MESSTKFLDVRVRVECIDHKAGGRPSAMGCVHTVPWYLVSLPVLNMHVAHGTCHLWVDTEGLVMREDGIDPE